jgi:TrkA domain protein
MELQQTPLPGVGVRYDLRTREGRQVGLVLHRDGRADLVVYEQSDPDSVAESVTLRPEERQALGELLAVPPGDRDPQARTHHRVWQLTEDMP